MEPTGEVVFDMDQMCPDCPVFDGMDRSKLIFTNSGYSYLRKSLEGGTSASFWSGTGSEDRDNLSVTADSVKVAYHGVDGEQGQLTVDATIQKANEAVARCAAARESQPDKNDCGGGAYGLQVERLCWQVVGYNEEGDPQIAYLGHHTVTHPIYSGGPRPDEPTAT